MSAFAERRTVVPCVVVFLAAFTAISAIRIDFIRGFWADEFWTLFMTQHDVGVRSIFADRWMKDIHPPIYYAMTWSFSGIFRNSVITDRLFNLIPLGVFTLAFSAQGASRTSTRSFLVAMSIMLFTLADFRFYLSEARSYFLVLVCAAISVGLSQATFDEAISVRQNRALAAILIIATGLWGTVHYINGLIACCFAGSCAVVHLSNGRRDWAFLFGVTAAVAVIICLVSVSAEMAVFRLQGPSPSSGLGALSCVKLFAQMALSSIKANPVIALAAAWTVLRDRSRNPYLSAVALGLALSLVGLAAFNTLRPTLIPRYIISVQALMVAGIAILAAPVIKRSRTLLAVAFLFAFLLIAKHAWFDRQDANWFATGRIIAAIKHECPAARVYVVRNARLGPSNTNTPPPNVETVRAIAYQTIADRYGFAINSGAQTIGPTCPTLLWAEHVGTPDISPTYAAEIEKFDLSRVAKAQEIKGYSGIVFAYWPRMSAGT